jgi:hypothetical protein
MGFAFQKLRGIKKPGSGPGFGKKIPLKAGMVFLCSGGNQAQHRGLVPRRHSVQHLLHHEVHSFLTIPKVAPHVNQPRLFLRQYEWALLHFCDNLHSVHLCYVVDIGPEPSAKNRSGLFLWLVQLSNDG